MQLTTALPPCGAEVDNPNDIPYEYGQGGC